MMFGRRARSHARLLPREAKTALRSLGFLFLLALPISVAFDVAFARLHHYGFREIPLILLSVDAILLTFPVLLILVFLHALCFVKPIQSVLRGGIWFSLFLTAWIPVASGWLWQEPHPQTYFAQGVVFAFLFLLLLIEKRGIVPIPSRPSLGGVWMLSIMTCAVCILFPPVPYAKESTPPNLVPRMASSAEAPNLLMIVLDTLRTDHLEAYGYEKLSNTWLADFAESATLGSSSNGQPPFFEPLAMRESPWF